MNNTPPKQPSPIVAQPGVSGNGASPGQGGFSLKPAGRKKPVQWKIVGVIICGILIVLIFTVVLAYFVIKSRADPEQEIDDSNVQKEVVTLGSRTSEDVMGEFMEANRSQSLPDSAKEGEETDKPDDGTSSSSSADNGRASGGDEKAEAQPTEREPETLFSTIARFDSSGVSQGTGGKSDSGMVDGDYGHSSDEEARLREFANADPAEIINRALQNQTNSGSDYELQSSSSGKSGLLNNLGASREYAMTKARKSPPRKYLLKRRTRFQCVLYTGVKTDYSGFVSCYLLRPLYSSDGSVILAEAGAELDGEQTVEVKPGQTSVFTSWTELETAPDGVRASLNGLGTDRMGRSGTDAYIDNHYGKRFGGAVMLSFVKDALSSASNLTKNKGNGYNVDNTEQNAEDMANKALENSINIPPTGYVLPGTVITVIVAQDIDFSTVYKTRK
ncbi:TrbI/VirB10 family protein [Salmonella enterica]|nr:TrbI/VirB10 family protein [Salmonella enterica]